MISTIDIPTMNGMQKLVFEPGRPIVILGPNGAGKTRLGIYIDNHEKFGFSHRIAAQRSLELPEEVFSEKYDKALNSLFKNRAEKISKPTSASIMSYDYSELVSALFAEHYRALDLSYKKSRGNKSSDRPVTVIENLTKIWHELIPHREISFSEMSVRANKKGFEELNYDAAEMSDGERVIFYLLGQALLVPADSLLIIDEPELHINRAIIGALWDSIEKSREDCSFVYITHDIDFATSRKDAVRFSVSGYVPPTMEEVLVRKRKKMVQATNPKWDISELPDGTGIPDEILTRIAGSRNPALFIEGNKSSIDLAVYRQIYQNYNIIPVESCSRVIQIVKSFQSQESLHRFNCAGLIDLDGKNVQQNNMKEYKIYTLPVSEVENLFLLPEVFECLANIQGFTKSDTVVMLDSIKKAVFKAAEKDTVATSILFTRRQIVEANSTLGIRANTIEDLNNAFQERISIMSPDLIFNDFKKMMESVIQNQNYNELICIYSNKGLLSIVAEALGFRNKKAFEQFISRKLLGSDGAELRSHLRNALPRIEL